MVRDRVECALCECQMVERREYTDGGAWLRYDCPACGEYDVSGQAANHLRPRVADDERHLLSGITRNAHEQGSRVRIRSADHASALLQDADIPRSILGKMDRLVLHLERKTDLSAGAGSVELDHEMDYSLAYCRHGELVNLLGYLARAEYVEPRGWSLTPAKPRLTPQGLHRAHELRTTTTEDNRAFVAMWFDDAGSMEQALDAAIRPACAEAGYEAHLVTDEQHYTEKVCEQVVAELRRCTFLIADFTGQRQNVYWEAGYAQALGKPVVRSCRTDCFDGLHFDTRQYPHIKWATHKELHDELLAAMRAQLPLRPRLRPDEEHEATLGGA